MKMDTPQYEIDELVWAKIKGYSWWPAVISHIEKGKAEKEGLYKVHFIGDNSHANLTYTKLAKYEQHYENHSKTKRQSLRESIQIAERIHSGEMKYDTKTGELIKRKEPDISKKIEPVRLKRKAPEEKVEEKPLAPSKEVKESKIPKEAKGKSKEEPKIESKEEPKEEQKIIPEFTHSKRVIPTRSAIKHRYHTEQTRLLNWIEENNPAVLVSKFKIVEDCFESIRKKKKSIEEVHESRIGHTMQEFVNFCGRHDMLSNIRSMATETLDKFKDDVLISFFGEPAPSRKDSLCEFLKSSTKKQFNSEELT